MNAATKPTPVANRIISWLVLLFGLAEVPWVIYLMFNQDPTVQANHLRLASIGMSLSAAVLCAGTAWLILRKGSVTAAIGVAAATLTLFLATMVTLSPSMQSQGLAAAITPLATAIPAGIAAIFAATVFLRGTQDARRTLLLIASAVLAVVAVSFLVHTASHAMSSETTGWMSRARAVVVVLDTAESVGLIGAGIASLRGNVRATLVFSVMAATLLSADAYGNVVGAPQGPAQIAALFYLIVGELPSIILLLIVARSAQRKLSGAIGEGTPAGPAATSRPAVAGD